MSKWVFILLRLTLISISLLTSVVQAQVLSTSVTESRWVVESGAFSCQLSHKIEGFGVWTMSRKTTQSEIAMLRIDLAQTAKKNIHLSSGIYKVITAPAAWKQQQIPVKLGELTLAKPDTDVVFPASLLPGILRALDASTAVMLVSPDAKPLRVQLQPFQFKDSYKQYKSCVAQLIPFTFEQITRNTLYYQTEEKELSASNKATLDKIVRYMKADPNRILGVLVDGHSDAQAEAAIAENLAKNQADWVAGYLKERGIAEDKIVVRSHADKYPVANNFLAKDRAKNRRVTVRLEDETIRQKNVEKIAELKKQAEEKAAAASAAASSVVPPPDFGDKLPIELELEKMVEGQDLEKVSPSEMP